jgi:hypothetical protein
MVEAFTIDTDNSALRDKGLRVNLVDNLENHRALTLLSQYEKHFHLIACV